MKVLFLFFPFLLLISCNTSASKQKSKLQLAPSTELGSTPIIEAQKIETVVQKDISIPVKEVHTTVDSIKTIPKPKTTPVAANKQIVAKKTPKTIKQQEVVEGLVVEKKQVLIRPSHDIWDKLTKTYVSPNGKVNYSDFKSAVSTIDEYLLHLQNIPPTKDWSINEKLAYWFNVYNASTVHLVVTNYPVKSIKDINDGKPWDKKFIKSGTNLYSLNDIENTIVRPNFNEPRLHVAFNCAAVSCPNLLNQAFTPTKLNTQLNLLSKQWINDSSKNIISPDKVQISQLFNWYKRDFKEGIIPFINSFSTNKANTNAEISFLEYDWTLNN